jgi:ABC-type cobalamin/Fe3+-siderophores transport system ATPase subunit
LIEGTFSSVWLMSADEPMQQGPPEEMLRPEFLESVFRCSPQHRPRLLEHVRSRMEQSL